MLGIRRQRQEFIPAKGVAASKVKAWVIQPIQHIIENPFPVVDLGLPCLPDFSEELRG